VNRPGAEVKSSQSCQEEAGFLAVPSKPLGNRHVPAAFDIVYHNSGTELAR
jgi:hypothetical protein